jgi:hypothetical protein
VNEFVLAIVCNFVDLERLGGRRSRRRSSVVTEVTVVTEAQLGGFVKKTGGFDPKSHSADLGKKLADLETNSVDLESNLAYLRTNSADLSQTHSNDSEEESAAEKRGRAKKRKFLVSRSRK